MMGYGGRSSGGAHLCWFVCLPFAGGVVASAIGFRRGEDLRCRPWLYGFKIIHAVESGVSNHPENKERTLGGRRASKP